MDLTPILNASLQQRSAKVVEKKVYDISKINLFLQEAYSIVRPTILRGATKTAH